MDIIGGLTLDLSVEVVGGGLFAVVACLAMFLRSHTAKPMKALWQMLYSVPLRAMAWAKAYCTWCWQQLKDAPLPLQVAAWLCVLNGWGIAALDTYAGLSIGWLHVYPMLFLMAAAGAAVYAPVLRFRRARAGRKGSRAWKW